MHYYSTYNIVYGNVEGTNPYEMIIFDVRDSQTGLHKSQPNVHDTAECPYVQARRVPVLQSMQTKFMQIPSSIKFCTLKPVGISKISILFQPHRIEAGPQHENFDSDGLQVAQFRYPEEGGLIILTPLTRLRVFATVTGIGVFRTSC